MSVKRLKGISLFSSAGIGETYFGESGIDIVIANEIIPKRAELYKKLHPNTDMICGDIQDGSIFNEIVRKSENNIDFLIASPPCQGMSIAGKNRCGTSMAEDSRNHLFIYVVEMIKTIKPTYIIIENVPRLLSLVILYKEAMISVLEILKNEFSDEYFIDSKIVDSADLGVPQTRMRAIIKMHKKNTVWNWPKLQSQKISVREAIGHLPSLESGQCSEIPWHYARNHDDRHVLWMKHTPTGETAFKNKKYFPQKNDGTRIKGYDSSYRRIKWNEPSPTITIRNDAISSQRNVHPGRMLEDGTYSDARVLTILELMILNSLPIDWGIPMDTSEILIRQCIGESIPPLMLKKIIEEIEWKKD